MSTKENTVLIEALHWWPRNKVSSMLIPIGKESAEKCSVKNISRLATKEFFCLQSLEGH